MRERLGLLVRKKNAKAMLLLVCILGAPLGTIGALAESQSVCFANEYMSSTYRLGSEQCCSMKCNSPSCLHLNAPPGVMELDRWAFSNAGFFYEKPVFSSGDLADVKKMKSAKPDAENVEEFSDGIRLLLGENQLKRIKTAYFIACNLATEKRVMSINDKIKNFEEKKGELNAVEAIYIAYYTLQTDWGLQDLEIAQLLPDVDYIGQDHGSAWHVSFNPAMLNHEPEMFFGVVVDATNGTVLRTWDIKDVEG